MSLTVRQESNNFDFQICPQGNHMAVCFSVIDLGVQEVNYQGETSYKRKVRVSWELPNEPITQGELAGQPFSISKNYTMSLHEKSVLYKDLVSWRGRAFTQDELNGFDLFNILGAGCMLNVIHTTTQDGQKTYANASSVSQLPKGMKAPTTANALRSFSTDNYDDNVFNSLPEWLKEKINLPMPQAAQPHIPQAPQEESLDDDIPF